eukprot:TRINITY_DN2343_c0_g1_i7.p2 TRINITY_DN2343_c0_g1~~TRINITY_DN2343_c0_g1_i7.p2  ORF type:complete len:136 (+),score=48.12 TRINITY_DN2343_c0_g1_i7:150-557(+)
MFRVAVAAALVAVCGCTSLRRETPKAAAAKSLNSTSVMRLTPRKFMEVKAGPYSSEAEACDACAASFTKAGMPDGSPPVEPVAPSCVCFAYPDDGGVDMFCSTAPSAANFVKEKGGCTCKPRNMEQMGSTTCTPL